MQPQTQLSSSRRLMLPATEQMTREAADLEDSRKIRYGFSPSYFLNLGSLTGNRYTGYREIFPRTLYRFEAVFPTGINEDPDRIDEKKAEQSPYSTVARSPRTCAEDVQAEAGERLFVILDPLTDRPDALRIWDLIYPIEAEAEIFAMTERKSRGPVEQHLREFYEEAEVPFPYVKEGHPLARFISHLEQRESELAQMRLGPDLYEVVEATRVAMLHAAQEVFQHRYSRLQSSFGSMQSRQNTGIGKMKLDAHDEQCLAETGIRRPEEKPVEASQRFGAAMGEKIAEANLQSQNSLAQAVSLLAEGQQQMQQGQLQMQQQLAQQNAVIVELLKRQQGGS